MGLLLAMGCVLGSIKALAQRSLDTFDDPGAWSVQTPEGVVLTIHKDAGASGDCLRLDYEFTKGGGFCVIARDLAMQLPGNYEFSFLVRGVGKENNLECKLVDAKGDSVWWVNRRAYEWPAGWTRLSNKKRRFEFAWGPSGGAPLTAISRIEFAIASAAGGKGSVWLDELTFRELPEHGSLAVGGAVSAKMLWEGARPAEHSLDAHAAVDHDPSTAYFMAGDRASTIIVDQGATREFGGVEVVWGAHGRGRSGTDRACWPGMIDLAISDDETHWTHVVQGAVCFGDRTIVQAPDAEARYVRLVCHPRAAQGEADAAGASLVSIGEFTLLPWAFSATPNSMFEYFAAEAPRGRYPRQYLGEQSYWTVVGSPGSSQEALMNEEGQVEVGKRLFSIEPFVVVAEDGAAPRVLCWADGSHTQSLAQGKLPIPTVVRTHDGLDTLNVAVTAWTEENYGVPWLMLRYAVTNTGVARRAGALHLAVRPFQVNPPWQRLNFEGGFSPIRRIDTMIQPDGAWAGKPVGLRVSGPRGSRDVFALSGPEAITVSPSDDADAVALISRSRALPSGQPEAFDDPRGLLGATIVFDFDLAQGGERACLLGVPMADSAAFPLLPVTPAWDEATAKRGLAHAEAAWAGLVASPTFELPESERWIAETFASQLAYILINRDAPALQPGSRSYERSWARDGSMTSAALLECGRTEEARVWIDWYGANIFDNGKVPCVVDSRGPDPVNEHDSGGQYLWAVANYYKFTKDRAFLAEHWARVRRVVAYIQMLRAERMTAEYREEGPLRAMFGLVPESISHEGYSAKPMHSYWDDFFVLLGLKQAAILAAEMGDAPRAGEYAALEKDFRASLAESIALVMKDRHIGYIPGCVELGDFDPTSTTIALFPCDEAGSLPAGALRATFEKYWAFAQGRISGSEPWEAYTPYEIRHVGAFVRLGERDRAIELLRWFRTHQRPQGWNHWAEVVWHDAKSPKFLGDMPHTWVASDFLHSVLAMFAYEERGSLVLFSGVPRAWIESGETVGVAGVHTAFGELSASVVKDGSQLVVRVSGLVSMPAGGIKVKLPEALGVGEIEIKALPAEIRVALPGT